MFVNTNVYKYGIKIVYNPPGIINRTLRFSSEIQLHTKQRFLCVRNRKLACLNVTVMATIAQLREIINEDSPSESWDVVW